MLGDYKCIIGWIIYINPVFIINYLYGDANYTTCMYSLENYNKQFLCNLDFEHQFDYLIVNSDNLRVDVWEGNRVLEWWFE